MLKRTISLIFLITILFTNVFAFYDDAAETIEVEAIETVANYDNLILDAANKTNDIAICMPSLAKQDFLKYCIAYMIKVAKENVKSIE